MMEAGLSHLGHLNATQDLGNYGCTEKMRRLELSGSRRKTVETELEDSIALF